MLVEIQEQLPAFARQVGQEGLARLLEVSSRVGLHAGDRLLRRGQPTDSLYLLVAGTLAAQVQHAQRTVEVGRIGAGAWIGEVSVLSGQMTASADVVAVDEVVLLRLRHQAFFELTGHFNPLADALVRMMVVTLTARVRGFALREIPAPPVAPPAARAGGVLGDYGWLGRRLGLRRTGQEEV